MILRIKDTDSPMDAEILLFSPLSISVGDFISLDDFRFKVLQVTHQFVADRGNNEIVGLSVIVQKVTE